MRSSPVQNALEYAHSNSIEQAYRGMAEAEDISPTSPTWMPHLDKDELLDDLVAGPGHVLDAIENGVFNGIEADIMSDC